MNTRDNCLQTGNRGYLANAADLLCADATEHLSALAESLRLHGLNAHYLALPAQTLRNLIAMTSCKNVRDKRDSLVAVASQVEKLQRHLLRVAAQECDQRKIAWMAVEAQYMELADCITVFMEKLTTAIRRLGDGGRIKKDRRFGVVVALTPRIACNGEIMTIWPLNVMSDEQSELVMGQGAVHPEAVKFLLRGSPISLDIALPGLQTHESFDGEAPTPTDN